MLFLLKWYVLIFFEIFHNSVFDKQKKNFRDLNRFYMTKKNFFFFIFFEKLQIEKNLFFNFQ